MVYLYNSLTRKKEEFVPLNPPDVGIYTCGPTVYDRKHIGNFRTYTAADLLVRVLQFNGYKVRHIMNFTDVGHLTGDNLGDADTGEDRIEAAAKREGRTAWDIAKHYSDVFVQDFDKLNLLRPERFVRATDHIQEQIDLVKKLEERGLTYKISDGIYFDTVAFEKQTGKKYGELATLDEIREGARVEPNRQKRNPRDFALWKFSQVPGERHMEWESTWGLGFPGWHIECSAMSMKYLGESFDIHVGGEDLRQTHHPNEIAQSEGATGKPFVKYWIHGAFILIDGQRMATSKRNNYNLGQIEEKGFSPLALRYLYLNTHYKQIMNFTWDSLQAAQNAYERLRTVVYGLQQQTRGALSEEKDEKRQGFVERFTAAINDDLGMPQALAVVWEVVKSNIPSEDKLDLLHSFDEVLGLDLRKVPPHFAEASRGKQVPQEVEDIVSERERLRKEERWEEADKARQKIHEMGYTVEDTPEGPRVKKR